MKKEMKRNLILMVIAVFLAIALPRLDAFTPIIGEIATGFLKLIDACLLLWIFYTIVVKANRNQ